MSTPPDFFESDNDESRPEQQPEPDRHNASTAVDEEQGHPAPRSDTGPQHRVAPPPVGEERWPAPAAVPATQPPRWQPPSPQSGPPRQAPQHHSGPITRPPVPPQAPPPNYGTTPGQVAPRPDYQRAATDQTSGNAAGLHHRPPQQGSQQPPASPPPQPDPSDLTVPTTTSRPFRRNEEDLGERTSIISPEDVAQARELGGFFTEHAEQGPAQYPANYPVPNPNALFNGPMGGEPFVPAGYGAVPQPDTLAPTVRRIDSTGWRKAVRIMTFGLIKPGPSAKQIAAEELIRRIRASLVDVFVVAFVNSKGGVGKTTMAVAAGNAIARERGDRVIVVDVDTDLGNLSARFFETGGPDANIEKLAALKESGSYSNIRRYTVQNDDRLEMLSSQNNPRSSYRLTSTDFESTMKILKAHYNVVLLDCGTSITSPLFSTIAKHVNCLVVVADHDAPGLNGASRTLAWLASHGFSNLLPRTVVVLNKRSAHKPKVDMVDAESQFREHSQHVVSIPFDDHLSEGAAIEFHRMGKKTQKAVMELAGTIAYFYPSRQSHRPEGGEGIGGF